MRKLLVALLLGGLSCFAQADTHVIGGPPAAWTIPAPQILGKTGIPFVKLGSCTVSAAGALSACTALPFAYPNAYCHVPASTVASSGGGSTAGWYYCTFSTTQAGQIYNNAYTTGAPAIPAAPVTPTTAASFTGETTETDAVKFTVPGNSMGANGALRITALLSATNNANAKAWRLYVGTAVIISQAAASLLNDYLQSVITNRGATNVQISVPVIPGFGTTTGVAQVFALDTTQAQTIKVTLQSSANAADNVILESVIVELLSDGT